MVIATHKNPIADAVPVRGNPRWTDRPASWIEHRYRAALQELRRRRHLHPDECYAQRSDAAWWTRV
jgi:hypothetical protein